jgi:hypothetical protein
MRNNGGYTLKTIQVNGIWFKGQYAEAYELFDMGKEITLENFHNGSYEATTPLIRFRELLSKAQINHHVRYKSARRSKRSSVISKLGGAEIVSE